MPRRRHPLLTAFQYMGKKGLWGCGSWGCSRARGEAPTFSQEAAGGGGRGWGTTNGVGWEALLILLLISSRPIPPESTWVVVPWGRGRGEGAKGRRRRWRNGRRRKRKRRGTLGVAARSLLGGGGGWGGLLLIWMCRRRARQKTGSTESMRRPPLPLSSPPLDSKIVGKRSWERGVGGGERWRTRVHACSGRGEMIFMYLLIECRHHRRLLPALSFHVKSSPASGGGGGWVVFSGTLCATVCSRIDECKRWCRWWDTIRIYYW